LSKPHRFWWHLGAIGRFRGRPIGASSFQFTAADPEADVLSHDQERQLELIGAQIHIEDPRFAEGLTNGRPHRPRQYRAVLPLFELVAAVLFITGSALMDAGAAVAAGAAAVVILGALWARRRLRLDRPPGRHEWLPR
jgi:hypothetical protein